MRTFVALALALTPTFAFAAPPTDDPLGSNYIADVAERVTPAVVNIVTETTRRNAALPPGAENAPPFFRDFFGNNGGGQRREMGAGSGVVISADGYIVTNNHVVERADTVKISFNDQREYRAKVIGTDKSSDLALLKVDATGLPHLALGDSSKLRLGEYVLAVGNPFGVGQTVTMGIVSAKGRSRVGIVDYEDFIQTDAAINPGNSGGALVNMRGELVGINTAILSRSGGAQGIGFAVPTSMVRPIVDQIRQHGRVRRGFLGVGIQDLTPDIASSFGLPSTVEGVLVSDVQDEGPAAKADVKPGDVILTVNGAKTRSASELRNTIAMLGPTGKAKLEVLREGKKRTLDVALTEKRDDQAAPETPSASSSPLAGMNLRDLDGELRGRLRAPPRLSGVVVTEVAQGSPAEEAGVQEGDVITHVDRTAVGSSDDVRKLGLEKRERVLLRVWRKGTNLFLVIRR
jgi:serine protease Do